MNPFFAVLTLPSQSFNNTTDTLQTILSRRGCDKDKMQRLATADFDLFAELVSEAPADDTTEEEEENTNVKKPKSAAAGAERLSTVLAGLKTTSTGAAAQKGGKTAKSYDWYQKNDPRALARLEAENPKEFDRLLNEYESNME